jgi:hypothetical protein
MLFALLVKAFFVINKYTLIKIGKLKSPYRLNWEIIKKTSSFYLGTDLDSRVKAAKILPQIFASNQDNKILANASQSFRRSLGYAFAGIIIALVGIIFADGQAQPLILSAIAAIAVVTWGIAKA